MTAFFVGMFGILIGFGVGVWFTMCIQPPPS